MSELANKKIMTPEELYLKAKIVAIKTSDRALEAGIDTEEKKNVYASIMCKERENLISSYTKDYSTENLSMDINVIEIAFQETVFSISTRHLPLGQRIHI
jgi:hypothetical protein